MSAVVFEPDAAFAELPEDQLEALLAGTATEPLRAAGVVGDRGVAPALAAAVAAVAAPLATVAVARDDTESRLWVSPGGTAVVMPAGYGRRRIVEVPTRFVPDALARLVDLGPRPRPREEAPPRLRFTSGALATLLATRRPVAALDPDPAQRAAADALVAGLRTHWRVEARWDPAPGSAGLRVVEVVDTETGMWFVVPDGPDVELWPATPTAVFSQLAGLLPRDAELARG